MKHLLAIPVANKKQESNKHRNEISKYRPVDKTETINSEPVPSDDSAQRGRPGIRWLFGNVEDGMD